MSLTRLILPTTLAMALGACAPGGGDDEESAPSAPFGYELAAVQGTQGDALT